MKRLIAVLLVMGVIMTAFADDGENRAYNLSFLCEYFAPRLSAFLIAQSDIQPASNMFSFS